ncbi:MAG: hypothetical protein LBS89_00225 [Zoogloeaceae bacterium]|jgi:uncharacterized membrane protein YfcA|nr:hypothetical protein [Zoogloeaceae bacterium]
MKNPKTDIKDQILLLLCGLFCAFLAWAFFHYVGGPSLSILFFVTFWGFVASNHRLRRKDQILLLLSGLLCVFLSWAFFRYVEEVSLSPLLIVVMWALMADNHLLRRQLKEMRATKTASAPILPESIDPATP